MNLLPNKQQAEIAGVVRAFLADKLSVRRYQQAALQGAPYPAALWQELVDLGWFGIGVAEGAGGMGLGLGDEVLLAREAGRQLVSPSVLATSVATQLLARTGNTAIARTLIDGSARVAVGLPGAVTATDEGVTADVLVFDAAETHYLLACDRQRCFLVETAAVTGWVDEPCTDESLSMRSGRLVKAPIIACSTEAGMRQVYTLFIVAALSGIAEAGMDAAVAYAGERQQFGQAIGSFQAISHLCADMAVQATAAWSQCVYAALALEQENGDAAQAVASAAVIAPNAALGNARANVQIHGGVGFTVEYDAHLYAKRSHVYRQLLEACLDTLAELVPRDNKYQGAVV